MGVSIVTVVFNGEKYIEPTIISCLEQTYKDVEYIIIDGGSSDRTVDIIRKYEKDVSVFVSENDNGIYDAMNKGIQLATKDWILFMNAGDVFCTVKTLEILLTRNEIGYSDIIYGDHLVDYLKAVKYRKAGKIEDLNKGSQFCHQSALIKTSVHKENLYNIHNTLSADFEFFYNGKENGLRFAYVDQPISKVLSGGVSDVKRVEVINSWRNVVFEEGRPHNMLLTIHYCYLKNRANVTAVVKNLLVRS